MTQIAFLGCAHIHMPNFIKMCKARTDIVVKSVWDHDGERAKRRGEELGAKVAGDFREILADPEIKGVIVSSETVRHAALVLPAAAAKKHMFVEKPMALGTADAYRMADAINRAGVIFQTGYQMRGMPFNLFIRQQIEKGSFGKITRIRHSTAHAGALNRWFDTEWQWMADPKKAGVGGFGDLGTHSLDLLIWLMGDVESCTASINNGIAAYPKCDEVGEALIQFKNGVIGTLAAAWDDVANPVQLLISGTEGHAAIIDKQVFFQSKHVAGADGKQPWTDLPAAWPHPLELWLDAVAGDRRDLPLVSATEAAYRGVVMEAMYKAARTGKWVRPTPPRTAAKRRPAAKVAKPHRKGRK